MCLSKVIDVTGGGNKQLGEYVSNLKFEDGKIVFTDIMGIETVVTGHVTGVDLINNTITIEQ